MKNPQSINPFLMIRATVEAEIAAPGILAISSALASDGKTSVSAGIAQSLAGGGYRTLVVDAARPSEPTVPAPALTADMVEDRVSRSIRPTGAGCDYLALSSLGADVSSAVAIGVLYSEIRSRYQYAIVDAAVLNGDGLALARGADGVVLAVREGRAVASADAEAVELLERLHARFLGVVATTDSSAGEATERATLLERLQPGYAAAPRAAATVPVAEANPVARLTNFFGRLRNSVVTGPTTPE